MSLADELQLYYYNSRDEGVLPQTARWPWTAIGGGGALVASGVDLNAAATRKGYELQLQRTAITDRIELQIRFQGATNNPTWSSGLPGHVIWVDDGARQLGFAIGTVLGVVHPTTGASLWTVPAESYPGGFAEPRYYLLIKDGETWWELWVDGRRYVRLPYAAAAASSRSVATLGFGWQDSTGGSSGRGYWDRAEVGINEILPPEWKVARARSTMPIPLQGAWSERHEGVLRAIVGLAHGVQDGMARVAEAFTAAVAPTQEHSFDGSVLPSLQGWALAGDTGQISVVRDRVRIAASANPTYATVTLSTPINTDAVYSASARFLVRDYDVLDSNGRIGPYLQVRDGAQRCGVFLVRSLDNPDDIGWLLSDQEPGGALGSLGSVLFRVDPGQESQVELFLIGGTRVVLFVDGHIVEDIPYSRLANSTSERNVRIGREGSASISCVVDITDGRAALSYGDNAYRPLFLRRVAERLLFAGGCERNDLLDVWMRRRLGVFAARGSDRVITEIRRIACDDDAELVVNLYPGSWYLGITFPMVTPTFISVEGNIPEVFAEYRANAPNFTPDELQKLIEWYLLPQGAQEAQFFAALVTTLTAGTATVGDHSEFTVESALGFEAGDDVTLRGVTTGTLLSLTYDSDANLADLGADEVRDFSGAGDHGVLSGTDASYGNTDYPERHGVVLPDNASLGLVEGIRSPSLVPSLSTGFTVAGWFRNDIAHDGTRWTLGKTHNDTSSKGYEFFWAASGVMTATVYGASGGKTFNTPAQAPAAGTWVHWAMRWNSATNILSVWKNGVLLSSSTSAALTVADPLSNPIGFGCDDTGTANKWKGQHRDHILFERTLTDGEMLTLYQASQGREELRDEAAVRLSYLPSGWPAILATHDDVSLPLSADYLEISAQRGAPSAEFALVAPSLGNLQMSGILSFVGKQNERTNTITSGEGIEIQATGAGAGPDGVYVQVFGLDPLGEPLVVRELILNTDIIIPFGIEFSEVHGAICEVNAPSNIEIRDLSDSDVLYTIAVGTRARGVYLFDPPLLSAPSRIGASATGASTESLVVWGAEEGGVDVGEEIVLAGTASVVGTTYYRSVRVIAAGYVPNTRTVLFSAALVHSTANITVVSSNAGDTQGVRVFIVDTMGEAHVLQGTLTGTTPIAISLPAGKRVAAVVAVLLESAAVGNVTTRSNGTPTSLLSTITAGDRHDGIDVRDVRCTGTIGIKLQGTIPVTDRYVVLYGRDEQDDLIVEAVLTDGSSWVYSTSSFTRLLGVCTGACPGNAGEKTWVRVAGVAFAANNANDAATALDPDLYWVATAGGGDLALDGRLDEVIHEDGTLAQVDLAGSWSETEDTTITTIDPDTGDVETPLLSGSFAIGAVMRKRAAP